MTLVALFRALRQPSGLRIMAPPLPRRVLDAVAHEQVLGERVTGWVQLAVVAVLAAFYYGAPKPDFFDYFFSPQPLVFAVYALFTAVRLWLSYRIALPSWFAIASTIIDVAVTVGLVWSVHLQYDQPPAFYLKAPVYTYLFLFIALRAIRFDALYVLTAGAAAAAGWLVLVIYAAMAAPNAEYATNDFVTYLTTSLVHWTSEIEKILVLLAVTGVLALAIGRARHLLQRAVAEETAARDLRRFFDMDVARRITGAEHRIKPGEGEIHDAATLFIDLRGFTTLSRRLSPSALIALLSDYQKRMVGVVQAHHGAIDKFLGDGIMASFGAAGQDPLYAANALRAVDGIMAAAAAWHAERAALGLPTPDVGAAVATGPVLFGAVGDESRLEYTVIGDAVNLAAKLEKQTKAEAVRALTTAETFRLAVAQGYGPGPEREARLAVQVGGVDRPLDLVVLA
jgi:adenylate cyclase